MPVVFNGEHGFCNHCATWTTVREPWDAPNITLCMPCTIAHGQAMDQAAAWMREARRALARGEDA